MVWDGQLARMPFHLKEGPQGTGVSFDVQVRRKVWYLVDYPPPDYHLSLCRTGWLVKLRSNNAVTRGG